MTHVSSLFAVVACSAALWAQTMPFKPVVPTSAATTESPTSTALPFGSTVARHVMFAYDGSTVGYAAPVRITAISLRCDGGTPGTSVAGTYNFTLDVSTSRNAVNALSTTFAANHGHDRLRVFNSALFVPAPPTGSAPNAFSLRIPLSTPFDWDPRNGPLLIDLGYSASTPAFAGWDAVNSGVGGLAATGATTSVATTTLTVAPVLRLEVVGDVVDASFANQEASTNTSFPWARNAGAQMRTINVYDPQAFGFGARQRITGLAWRTDLGAAFPGRTYTVRISLSTSPLTSATLSSQFALDHGPDLTVVFDGVLNAPASPASPDLGDFDLFVPLQRPFEYDPTLGALAVDMQLFDSTGTGVVMDCTIGTSHVGRVSDSLSATSAIGLVQVGVAMVMALQTVPVPTVPATLAGTVNPNANSGTSFPFGTTSCRTLLLLSKNDAAITQPFVVRHLQFRPTFTALSGGPTTYTITIDLSHAVTTPSTINATFDNNHGADRERVFDGEVSVPFFTRSATDAAFPIEVKLQRPFVWNPAASNYLAVDIRTVARVGPPVLIETTNGFTADGARLIGSSAAATTGSVQTIAPVVRLGGSGQHGLAVNEGSGCSGLNGVPFATTVGLPSLPNPDLRMRIHNAAGNSAAFFIVGFAPLNIALPGTNNCLVLNLGEVGSLAATITDPSGDGQVAFPLIGSPAADGFQFRGQWWILDPTANALGIVTSDNQLYTARWF